MPTMSSNDVMALLFVAMIVCCGCIALMRLAPSAGRAYQSGKRAVRAYRPRIASMSFSSTSGQLSAVLSQPEAPSDTKPAVPTLPILSLMTAGNILVVGPSGSGKSTLLRHLATVRPGAVVALDPHNIAGSWPGIPVFGGGLEWSQIGSVMQQTYGLMQRRYQALNSGTEREFTPLTLVSDEYRAIARALPGNRHTGERAASEILRDLITQARKVTINVLAASQSDTVESLGFAGESDLKACFQYVVYLGASAIRKAPADAMQTLEQHEHKAVAVHTETGRVFLLQLPPISVMHNARRLASEDTAEVQALIDELRGSETALQPLPAVSSAVSPVAITQTEDAPLFQETDFAPLARLVQAGLIGETKLLETAFCVRAGSSKEYQVARSALKAAISALPERAMEQAA